MAQGHKFQDLEETGEALVAFINSSQPEKLRQVKVEHQALFDQHMETRKTVTHILKGKKPEMYLSLSLFLKLFVIFNMLHCRGHCIEFCST